MKRESPLDAAALLQAFASEQCMTREAHELREEALERLPKLLADSPLTFDNSHLLFFAYMLCSYGFTPGKHEIKKTVNRMVRGFLDKYHIRPIPYEPKRRNGRPHLLVISSWLNKAHAVSRCFRKDLIAMRERFETTALVFTEMDAEASEIFDRTLVAPATQAPLAVQVRQLAALVSGQIRPDLILYADIAMHPFCVCLSNMRLASFQAQLTGHPASSYSDCIDAVIVEDAYARALPSFTEAPLTCPTDEHAVYLPDAPALPLPRRGASSRPVRIAVPGVMPKLSYPFLAMLGKISNELGDAAKIVMTTYSDPDKARAVEHDARLAMNLDADERAEVYSRMNYAEYLSLLDSCDMFLNPYNFGGSNTVIDALRRGLPGVTLEGNEIFSMTGAVTVNRCGLPSIPTTARTERQYHALAVHMAINRELRETLSARLRETFRQPERATFFAPHSPGYARELSKAFAQRAQ